MQPSHTPKLGAISLQRRACAFRNTALPINKRSFEKLICQVHVSQLPQNRLLERQVYSIPPQLSSSECTMWADPNYLRCWRDLRRRELLFWFFVLSYVPGFLL